MGDGLVCIVVADTDPGVDVRKRLCDVSKDRIVRDLLAVDREGRITAVAVCMTAGRPAMKLRRIVIRIGMRAAEDVRLEARVLALKCGQCRVHFV